MKPTALPRQATVPAIGGELKVEVEDFVVEELPAYEPGGEGPHHYLWVEKRDVDGRTLVQEVARYFGVEPRHIGTAGVKDRRAVTRQWVSAPAQLTDVEPEPKEIAEGVEVLEVSRHTNKLRTGHLRGNRFDLRIRETELQGEALREAMEGVEESLQDQGLANFYGMQRFGHGGSTLAKGLAWLEEGRAPSGRFLRRMSASAVQSEIFNRMLMKRLEDGSWKQVCLGDIFEKVDTGGRFWISEEEEEETQARLDGREIVVTGPMPGSEGGFARQEVGQRERELVEAMGIEVESLESFGAQGKGTRRPMTVYLDDLEWSVSADDVVELAFSLPSGSYATVVLKEFMGDKG